MLYLIVIQSPSEEVGLQRRTSFQMYTTIWLLLCCLAVVQPSTLDYLRNLKGMPIVRNNEYCNRYYLDIVDYSFAKTTVVPKEGPELEYEYCGVDERRARVARAEPDHWQYYDTDLEEIIDLYESFPYVRIHRNRGPVLEYGVIELANSSNIPLYLIASIRYEDTTGDRRRIYPPELNEQLRMMGRLDTDERGHLLALSLGGGNHLLNFIPMARNLNRHLPHSHWRTIEQWILRFLQRNQNGRVSWRLALQYQEDTLLNPANYHSYRPVGLSLQYTAYTDRNDDDSIEYRSPQISFLNDNEFSCNYRENLFRRRRSLHNNEMCYTDVYPRQPQGKMLTETSNGWWKQSYGAGFVYTIGGRHFIYAQADQATNWFIQEILPNRWMGDETDHGYWNYEYMLLIPFAINGRQYFYGSSTRTYNWFIQELLPGGKIGGETDHGNWNMRYRSGFSFVIEGRTYIYAQSIVDGYNWFIQEVLPGGRMGEETDHGSWNYKYSFMFPYKINDRQYFCGHGTWGTNWFIQELLPGGKMGAETSHGSWKYRYASGFPFAIGGKQYYYAQSIVDGNHWFIQELLAGGQMGAETDHGSWGYKYPVSMPLKINGRQYFCGLGGPNTNWFIQELM